MVAFLISCEINTAVGQISQRYVHANTWSLLMKCGMKLLIHTLTSIEQPLEFCKEQVISPHNKLGMWLITYPSFIQDDSC